MQKKKARKNILGFLKRWARYQYLAFVALLAVNAEALVRGIPTNPWLNYVLVGLVVLAALGSRLLRNSKWYDSYRKLVSRSIAWFFAAVGLSLLALVQAMIPLFSVNSSTLINMLLAVTIGVEFIAAGLLFYIADVKKVSEDELGTKLRKKDSMSNYDVVPYEPESGTSRTPESNVVELIDKVDAKFSQWRWGSTVYVWLVVVVLLFIAIYFTELTYQDLGARFAIAAAGIAVVLSMTQIMLDQIESWIGTSNYQKLRCGKEDLLLYALILMKAVHPGIRLRDVYHLNKGLFQPETLVERLYK